MKIHVVEKVLRLKAKIRKDSDEVGASIVCLALFDEFEATVVRWLSEKKRGIQTQKLNAHIQANVPEIAVE